MDAETTTNGSQPKPGSTVQLYNTDGSSREVKLVDITTDGKYVILNDGGENFTRPISRLNPPLAAAPTGVIDDAAPALDPVKIADAQNGHDAVAEAFERAADEPQQIHMKVTVPEWAKGDARIEELLRSVAAPAPRPKTRIETKFYIAESIDMKLENDFAVEELDELKNAGWRVVHRQFLGPNYYAELERVVIVDEPAPDQPSAAVEASLIDTQELPQIVEEAPEIVPAIPTPETAIALPADNPFKSQPLAVPTTTAEPLPAIEINAKLMAAAMLKGQSASTVIAMMDQQLMQRSAQRRQAAQ